MKHRLMLASTAILFGFLAAAPPSFSAPAWPQARSDIKPDPDVRFGVLPNGMRYAIMHNATPGGQTSLRLRVGSGSLEESDAQQGLAHVLEHMSFKGSTHVPAGEMIKILQRKGLAFGPDTNAQTEWTQTVYMLDLPRSDADTVDTGLMLMRETAGELDLDDKALTPERGVVLSEERLRDTPEYRAEKAQIELMAQGQRIVDRFPIGTVDVIKHAPISLLRDYYRANYRPDRTTLIAVGDFDPAEMEAKIKARFSDWKPVGPPTAEPDLGTVASRGLTAKVVQLPGSSTRSMIAWVHPHDASPDTVERRRRETIEALALAVLNRRLSVLAHGANPPFLNARAGYDDLLHSEKVAQIEAVSTPEAWRPALASIEREARRVTLGVGDVELAREITEMRASLVNAVAGAGTRRTPGLASDLVDAVDDDEVATDPATDLALFEQYVKGLKADEVTAAARAMFSGSGPLVELTSPNGVEGGDAALAATFNKDAAEPVSIQTADAAVTWPYGDFGPAGKVVARARITDMGAQSVRFANGVALTIKSTPYRKDQILVSVRIGGGRLDLSPGQAGSIWSAGALIGGGLKKISFEESQRALAGKIYAATFGVGEDALAFGGATQPRDLDTQLSVLAAYATDPGFRPEAFERLRAAYIAALPQLAATPDGVVNRDLDGLLHSDDPRWMFPSEASLRAATPDTPRALLGPVLAGGPIEITIVGDIDPDKAIGLVATTFGALPARAPAWKPPAAAEAPVRFPPPTTTPVTRSDNGRPDQAEAIVAWPTTDFFVDMKRSRAGMLAGEVLQNRILDEVRIAEGATYSPETEASFSETIAGYGAALSEVEMPPTKIPGFFATVTRITADLRDKGLTDDELARARNPRVSGIEKAQLTNEYWLDRLAGSIADPRRLDLIRTTLPDYRAITTADVQAAAKAYFVDGKAWKMVISAAK